MSNKPESHTTLRAGVARRCITPTRPVFQSGYGRSAKSEGVYQQLYARALVIEDADKVKVAILTAELLDFSESLVKTIKAGVNVSAWLAADVRRVLGTPWRSARHPPRIGGSQALAAAPSWTTSSPTSTPKWTWSTWPGSDRLASRSSARRRSA